MDSHEYARQLRDVAAFLESRPVFTLDHNKIVTVFFYDKDSFIAAARAIGSCQKKIDAYHYNLTPNGAPALTICAPRSMVCRRVQEEKYECDPLLSDAEHEALGTEAVQPPTPSTQGTEVTR